MTTLSVQNEPCDLFVAERIEDRNVNCAFEGDDYEIVKEIGSSRKPNHPSCVSQQADEDRPRYHVQMHARIRETGVKLINLHVSSSQHERCVDEDERPV